jgi:HSP20 family protein
VTELPLARDGLPPSQTAHDEEVTTEMLFDDPFAPFVTQLTRTATFVPPADLTISDGNLVLTLDVPGVRPENLAVELHAGYLSVRGERPRPNVDESTQWVLSERMWGRFERRISVPEGVDGDAITASLEDGVLTLTVPKPGDVKPRTIQIAGGRTQRRLEPTSS